MDELEKLKETILKEFPRLNKESKFQFKCHKDISCFNECCTDVNIFLTPYDIIRLKNRLGISSQEFLDKYTFLPIDEKQNHPVVMLKMEQDDSKSCPFVGSEGCSVYEDRPWSCRMFPLGVASPKDDGMNGDGEFYFILEEPICRGHEEQNKQTVNEWIEDQGVKEYSEMGEQFKEISLHEYFRKGKQLDPPRQEMFYTVCYNIDKLREFVFGSSFLKRFEMDDETIKKIKEDDKELLLFGYTWLKYCLFGEDTMKIKKSD